MSEPLLSPGARVSVASLPLSLRPSSADDAVNSAGKIAAFLQAAYRCMGKYGSDVSSSAIMGGDLCFDLLLDYLDIASGKYAFPLAGNTDSPALCARRE